MPDSPAAGGLPPLAVFRADGSRAIGAGHLIRCLSLMDGFATDGWRTGMAVNEAGTTLLRGVTGGVSIVADGADSWPDLTREWPEGCDALVVDHYDLGIAFERSAKGWAKKVIVIDDKPVRSHDCDVLIDQTAGRSASDYRPVLGARTVALCGSNYAMLRRRFAALRPGVVAKRKAPAAPDIRLFVTFGAGDNASLLARVLKALKEQHFPGLIEAVVGDKQDIPAQSADFGARCTVHVDPPDIAALMAEAHVALGAGGTNSWERAALGLPTFVIRTADNQSDVIAALTAAGAAESLGPADSVDLVDLTRRILALCAAPAAYMEMSRSAARLCDGLGVRRIVQAIVPEHDRDGRPVRLRPARPDDAGRMLEWQSQPGMRTYMHNPAVPKAQEHQAWFSAKLENPATLMNVIEVDDVPVGVLRLDFEHALNAWAIAFLIDIKQHGRGIGAAALRLAKRLLPGGTLIGDVIESNRASWRAFENAGFRRQDGQFVWGAFGG